MVIEIYEVRFILKDTKDSLESSYLTEELESESKVDQNKVSQLVLNALRRQRKYKGKYIKIEQITKKHVK